MEKQGEEVEGGGEREKKKSSETGIIITLLYLLAPIVIAFVVFQVVVQQQQQRLSADPILSCDGSKAAAFELSLPARYDSNQPHKVTGEDPLLGECAFRLTYTEARAAFREAADKAGFALKSILITKDGDKEYYTDVATLTGDPKRVLLHISGVHGPEGFAGSATQVAALRYFTKRQAGTSSQRRKLYDNAGGGKMPPTIILVHAINPFGMANNRRVNEDNIDVNRNFLTDEQLLFVKKRDPNFAGYVDVDFLLNPRRQLFPGQILISDIHGLIKTAYAAAVVGVGSIKRSLVAGNYYKQKGLGFGGFKRCSSVEALISLSQDLKLADVEEIVLVDVHTGLGPSGTDTLVYMGHDDATRASEIDRVFPLETVDGKIIGGMKEGSNVGKGSGAMAGYDLTIGTTDDFCVNWLTKPPSAGEGKKKRICVTQEFGTIGVIQVGKNLMDENYAFHWGNTEEKTIYGERLKASFFVQTNTWARAVTHRGLSVLLQAFDELLQ